MEDFSAPSFSLGIDDSTAPSFSLGFDLVLSDLPTEGEDEDDDEEEDPPIPPNPSAAGIQSENLQDFEEDPDSEALDPDLSLEDLPTEGEDGDDDEEEDPPVPPNPSAAGIQSENLQDFQEDPGTEALDPDLSLEDPPRILKRLRRGPPPSTPPPPAARSFQAAGRRGRNHGPARLVDLDDEIEEFSPQKEPSNHDKSSSLPSHASKAPLNFRRVLTDQPKKNLKQQKISLTCNTSSPASFLASRNKSIFPSLTVSPLRKFCLVESDSDDPSSSKDKYKDTKKIDACLRTSQFTYSPSRNENESLWNDFNPEKNTNFETPVLDEFCKEYFGSEKNTRVDRCQGMSFGSCRVVGPDDFEFDDQQKSSAQKTEQSWNLTSPQPPAYRYFYHDDARIRGLVRERFRYFFPLGSENHNRGHEQPAGENLDYMNQFGTGAHMDSRESSIKRGKKPTTANVKVGSHATGSWVNPKTRASIPKDAGKRRVSAGTNQSGRWLTGQDGIKVYITKDGQELTGRVAYMNFKKEAGGFQKFRKKTTGKKRKQ